MGTSPYGRNHDHHPFSFWPALGQTEDVQMLLSFGADPTLLDLHSRSAVDVLKRNKNFRAIEKINSHLEKLASRSKGPSGMAPVNLLFVGTRYKLIYLFFTCVSGSETFPLQCPEYVFVTIV